MKTFQEFITEVEAYSNIRSLAPYRVMPPLKTKDGKPNPAPQRFLINPKTGLGPTARSASPQVAQIVPTSKNSQLPFKGAPVGIDMTDREGELNRKVRTMERLGILHGGTRAKDLP